jgi:hypothetical protein
VGVGLQTLIAAHFADTRERPNRHGRVPLPAATATTTRASGRRSPAGGRSPGWSRRSRSPRCRGECATSSPRGRPSAQEAERQEEVVGRDAEGLEITRGEIVDRSEALTEHAKRAFEETAGPVEWSAPSEQASDAA